MYGSWSVVLGKIWELRFEGLGISRGLIMVWDVGFRGAPLRAQVHALDPKARKPKFCGLRVPA